MTIKEKLQLSIVFQSILFLIHYIKILSPIFSVFEKKNAERQFHTITHNKYDSREKFINWTCNNKDTCKTDQTKCTKLFEKIDIR